MNITNSAKVELVEQLVDAIALNEEYKGEFDNKLAIETDYPTGKINWTAYNADTKSNWGWNDVLGEWVNKNITYTDYKALRTSNLLASGGVAYHVTTG